MVIATDHSILGSLTSSGRNKAAHGRPHDLHVSKSSAIDGLPLPKADRKATKTIYQNPYVHLVGKLRERREELGMSQTQLAAHLEWPQQRISSIESASRRLDVLEFCRLASALGMPSAEISDLIPKSMKAVRISKIK